MEDSIMDAAIARNYHLLRLGLQAEIEILDRDYQKKREGLVQEMAEYAKMENKALDPSFHAPVENTGTGTDQPAPAKKRRKISAAGRKAIASRLLI